MPGTELEVAAIASVIEAVAVMNEALQVAHQAGLEVEIDVSNVQKVSDRYPRLYITGYCKKTSYEINQPF